jgi:hypothetical protein
MELVCGIETPSLQLKDQKLRDALFETIGKGINRVTECRVALSSHTVGLDTC